MKVHACTRACAGVEIAFWGRLDHLLIATNVGFFFQSLLWSGPLLRILPFVFDVYTVHYCRHTRGIDNYASGGRRAD